MMFLAAVSSVTSGVIEDAMAQDAVAQDAANPAAANAKVIAGDLYQFQPETPAELIEAAAITAKLDRPGDGRAFLEFGEDFLLGDAAFLRPYPRERCADRGPGHRSRACSPATGIPYQHQTWPRAHIPATGARHRA